LENEGEKQRAKWVTLLNPSTAEITSVICAKMGVLSVAGFDPSGEAGKMLTDGSKDSVAGDDVERIAEVNLEESKRRVAAMGGNNRVHCVENRLTSERGTNTKL
jgi:hypothetical protein